MQRWLIRTFPCLSRSKLVQVLVEDDSAVFDDSSVHGGASTTDAPPSSSSSSSSYRVRVGDVWCLGITIVIGGQYFSWNAGLVAGFGSYAVATGLIATAYVCLCFSVAELSSALPFAGGGYGLARVTLGFYAGFLVGCCEIVEYIMYVASAVLSLGVMVTDITKMDPAFVPLVWLVFYVSAVSVHVCGGTLFWRVNMALAVVSVGIVVVYCFGSLHFADIRNAGYVAWDAAHDGSVATTTTSNAASSSPPSSPGTVAGPRPAWFVGGFSTFMYALPLPAWLYVGVESLSFACTDIADPRDNIPRSSLACIAALVLTSVGVLVISSSLPPQHAVSLANAAAPLSVGFKLMFSISDVAATALSIPATYATAFGFIFSYGRLMIAMSESRLLPRVFRKLPSMAYITGSLVALALCLLAHFVPAVTAYLFNITVLSAFLAYISQLYGFIMLRTRFAALPRQFRSPLGVPGAVLGIVIFFLGVVAVVGFQRDSCTALIALLCIGAVNSTYYFTVAKRRQKFSKEELKITFVAHVLKLDTTTNSARMEMSSARMEASTAERKQQKKAWKKQKRAEAAEAAAAEGGAEAGQGGNFSAWLGTGRARQGSSLSLHNALVNAATFLTPTPVRSLMPPQNSGDAEEGSDSSNSEVDADDADDAGGGDGCGAKNGGGVVGGVGGVNGEIAGEPHWPPVDMGEWVQNTRRLMERARSRSVDASLDGASQDRPLAGGGGAPQ